MGADKTADYSAFNGILINDPRIVAVNETQSTYTQAGPHPGTAVPQQVTDATVVMSGDMPASTSLEMRAIKSGMPGQTSSAAGMAWRHTGDTDYRGHDAPVSISSWQSVEWVDAITSTNTPKYPHVVTLNSRAVLMAYRDAETVPASSDVVKVRRLDPDTNTWGSAVDVYDRGGTYSTGRDAWPCLLVLPNGRVLCFFYEELGSSDVQIGMFYSDDDGATWTRGAKNVLPDVLDYAASGGTEAQTVTFRRFRCAYIRGDIVMFLWRTVSDNTLGSSNCREVLVQYASSDLGCTFTEVDAPAVGEDDYNGVLPDVVSDGRQAWLVFHSYGTGYIQLTRLSSAYEAFSGLDSVSLSTPGATFLAVGGGGSGEEWTGNGDIAICLDDVGILWIYEGIAGTKVLAGGAFNVHYSDDFGATVVGTSGGMGKWFTSGDAETYPVALSCCWQRGRCVMAHQWTANPGNEDNSLAVAYLGGYSTATLPLVSLTGNDYTWRQTRWLYTWLPMDLPGDTIWTASGSGTESLTSGALAISTAGTARTYDYVPTAPVANGMIVRAQVKVTSGSALVDEVHLRLRLEDGASEYDISIRIGTAAVYVYDYNAAASVGNVSVNTTGGADILIALAGSSVVTYVRTLSHGSDREWTAGPSSTTLTDGGATGLGNLIRWGQSSSTATSQWKELHFMAGSGIVGGTGDQMTGATYPQDLHPRHWSSLAFEVDAGTLCRLARGPAYLSDEWVSQTAYALGFDRCAPWAKRQSPRIAWRTTGTSAQTIDFDLDQTLTAASRYGKALYGIGFFGCNGWRTGTIYARDAAGSYSALATINAASGMDACRFTRSGNTVYAGTASGGDTAPYVFTSEFNGAVVDLGSSKFRTIAQTYEGRWTDAGGLISHLVLEGVDGTEPSNGTLRIIPRDFAILFQVNAATARGIRIVIDSQTTPDGYFEIGQMVAGPVMVHGLPTSWGRTVDIKPQEEVVTTRDVQRWVRKVAPHARTIAFGWVDGVDTTGAFQDASPDYVATSSTGGTPAGASVNDVPQQMEGISIMSNGSRDPLVYLPRIPKGPSDVRTINRRNNLVLFNLTSPVAIEVVQGNESATEVQRVAMLEGQEIV